MASSITTSTRLQISLLVVGGSGYVGQFVIEALLREGGAAVHVTHRPGSEVEELRRHATCHVADYTDTEAISSVLREVRPSVVVNCGAMSGLGPCEKDPAAAEAANCPCSLVDAVAREADGAPRLFIHFSTDIVFDGDPSKVYDEDATPAPVNTYGRLKAKFDSYLTSRTEPPHCVVLRLTNVVGPRHPYAETGTKFLQWLDKQLRVDAPIKLFEDEFRNYVWVEDVAALVAKLVADFPTKPPHKLMHCGGPDALSRLEVAHALVVAKGYSLTYKDADGKEAQRMLAVPRASVDLGYASPLCVVVKSARAEAYLGRPLRRIGECIRENASRI